MSNQLFKFSDRVVILCTEVYVKKYVAPFNKLGRYFECVVLVLRSHALQKFINLLVYTKVLKFEGYSADGTFLTSVIDKSLKVKAGAMSARVSSDRYTDNNFSQWIL